jgi:hypothetical protein
MVSIRRTNDPRERVRQLLIDDGIAAAVRYAFDTSVIAYIRSSAALSEEQREALRNWCQAEWPNAQIDDYRFLA